MRSCLDSIGTVRGIKSVERLGEGATDSANLREAAERGWVFVTRDKDFRAPPIDDHAGVVVLTDEGRSPSEFQRAVRKVFEQYDDINGHIVYVSDWVQIP